MLSLARALRLAHFAIAALTVPIVFGQQPYGEIRVVINDPSGAPVEASGILVHSETRAERRFQTNSRGSYTLDLLPFGHYQLDIAKPGFRPQSIAVDVQSPTLIVRTITLILAGGAFTTDVVASTPLPGIELARDQIPSPVQLANRKDIEDSGALDLSDFLNRRLTGVHVNEIQGNPYQPDINYRGYTASPLLGTPQGLSVYMDGVRLNQPFGDVVSWDLIPKIAISEVTLMPGSNPLFGLNTLGGALSVQTKDGNAKPGTTIGIFFSAAAIIQEFFGSIS